MRFIHIASIVAIAGSPCFANDPTALAKSFYGEPGALDVRGYSDEEQLAKVRPVLTDDLNACFTAAQKAVAIRLAAELRRPPEFIEIERDGKKERIEIARKWVYGRLPVFQGNAEGAEFLGVGESIVSANRAYVEVKMKLPGEEVRWSNMLVLHLTPAGWRIDDVLFGIEKGELSSSVRSNLAQDVKYVEGKLEE